LIRLNIVVEGPTEETFVRDVLAPYWGEKEIFAIARSVETGRRRGRVFRGGVQNYEKMQRDVLNWIRQQRDTYCTTMFDLYRLPRNFPGKNSIDPNLHDYKRVSYLEAAFAADIGSDRFIPYIQLHEFESLLFADIDRLKIYYLDDKNKAVERLSTMANSFSSPELINEGDETAPSKRIIKEIPTYKDNKVVIGPAVAGEIGLPVLRERCAHFNEWLTKIENLSLKRKL